MPARRSSTTPNLTSRGRRSGHRFWRTSVLGELQGGAMYVQSILAAKGADVATITPDASVREAVALLNERRVGALVVSTDGHRIDGILSERDVVRSLAARATAALDQSVADLMT